MSSSGIRTIESIIYNKVAVAEFMRNGGFKSFPGISVSKKGWIYVKENDRTAPLMLMFGDEDICVRGCYSKTADNSAGGFRLLSVLPKSLCDSANDLFDKWVVNANVPAEAKIKKLSGSTYLNYKHEIKADFPIGLRSFGAIPMFYSTSMGDMSYAGVSVRVNPGQVLEWVLLDRVAENLDSDDDIVVDSAEASSTSGTSVKAQVKKAFNNPLKSFFIQPDESRLVVKKQKK